MTNKELQEAAENYANISEQIDKLYARRQHSIDLLEKSIANDDAKKRTWVLTGHRILIIDKSIFPEDPKIWVEATEDPE